MRNINSLFRIIIAILFFQSCSYDFTVGAWEDGIIPYYLRGEFSDQDVQNIMTAMKSWENVCGVRFKKVSPRSGAYEIRRVSRQEWYSSIGENNSQCRMIFGRSYSNIDVITHELGHCLGLIHEHQRPDRDLYINIIWSNILSGKEYNFEIIDSPLIAEQNFNYDYHSVMHYEPTAFSIDGTPTITPKGSETIIAAGGITALDAAKAREIYGPPLTDDEIDE